MSNPPSRLRSLPALLVAAVLAASLARPAAADAATASQVSAGIDHSCAVSTTGSAFCWGRNENGKLGDGTFLNRASPVSVRGLSSGVAAIAAGGHHTCAITVAGAVLCWGNNEFHQLGDGGSPEEHFTPVSASGLSSGVTALAAGEYHTCALTVAGAVLCWGSDIKGQLGDDNANLTRTVPTPVTGLSSGVTAISAGLVHTCALTVAGAVLCWGSDEEGQLGDGGANTNASIPRAVPSLTSGVSAIAAGGNHTCAVTTGGALQCWGQDSTGAVGDGSANAQETTPKAVIGLSGDVIGVAAGENNTCARTTAGALLCWGDNGANQLGTGSSNQLEATPAAVNSLSSGVSSIAVGSFHMCAIGNASALVCWGSDNYGQVGDGGANTTQPSPVPVADFPLVPTPTPTPTPTPSPSPTPVGPWLAPRASLACGAPITLSGGGFTAGSKVIGAIAKSTGIEPFGPLSPWTRTSTSLLWTLPCSLGLGNGFIALQIVNTDQNYATSPAIVALLLAAPFSGYPSITGVNGIAVTAAQPSYPLAYVETLIAKDSTITINGIGFATPAKVNLFTASGNAGPLDTLPGSTSTALLVHIPADVPTGPGALQVVNPGGSWPASNAVSVPLGASISVTSITRNGDTITVNGTGFSTLSVINLFTLGGTNHCGLVAGTPACPITFESDTRFAVQRPAATSAYTGPAFLQVINPPFIPFSSTGTDPDGAFPLTSP